MKAFVVLHTMLGAAGHRTGEIVQVADDQIKKGEIDVERWLRIGAVREATADEAKHAVKYGDSGLADAKPFPPVPFAPTEPGSAVPAETEGK